MYFSEVAKSIMKDARHKAITLIFMILQKNSQKVDDLLFRSVTVVPVSNHNVIENSFSICETCTDYSL